jgi:hypothetical protein
VARSANRDFGSWQPRLPTNSGELGHKASAKKLLIVYVDRSPFRAARVASEISIFFGFIQLERHPEQSRERFRRSASKSYFVRSSICFKPQVGWASQ